MIAMLARHLALAVLSCLLMLEALETIEPPPLPLSVDAVPSRHADAAVQLGGGLDALLKITPPELPAISRPSPYLMDTSTLALVVCGDYVGSAVYLGSGRYVTAAHVVTDEKTGKPIACVIAGQSVTIQAIDRKIDYALIKAAHYPPFRATISCERLRAGQIYFAAGFADGNPWPVVTQLRATGEHELHGDGIGTADVNGSIVSGMSGGSVFDSDGLTHAINDWRDDDGVPAGGVVELADTPLCGKDS
jgi:hypothetical protein